MVFTRENVIQAEETSTNASTKEWALTDSCEEAAARMLARGEGRDGKSSGGTWKV